eukprot:TRINITY_DN8851_c0_g1_i1.p1 TRINITY_DN8851_c0_g1~~TRINITY_DN8851_c0_g1_i1.p1  ORF type:complete len:572 (+),score=97.39 TRINITY_DN8851_c0_g1_i1:161-1876(+)
MPLQRPWCCLSASRCTRLLLLVFLAALPSAPADGEGTGSTAAADLHPGLVVEEDDGGQGKAVVVAIDEHINFWGRLIPQITLRWSGFLRIKEAGEYTFDLTASGACVLMLGKANDQVIPLGPNGTTGLQLGRGIRKLSAGDHLLQLEYEEEIGMAGVILKYKGPDSPKLEVIPKDAFLHTSGPCGLKEVPHIGASVCGGRSALGDGEQCQVACADGYYPLAQTSPTAAGGWVFCQNGQLKPDNICSALPCHAPQVPGTTGARCKEGSVLKHGDSCTPVCPGGLVPGQELPMKCVNGTLSGAFYDCHEAKDCTVDPAGIAHVSTSGPCVGGSTVKHGSSCEAQCEAGYAASRSPKCDDGLLDTPTAAGPAFECSVSAIPSTTAAPVPTPLPSPATESRQYTAVPTLAPTLAPEPASSLVSPILLAGASAFCLVAACAGSLLYCRRRGDTDSRKSSYKGSRASREMSSSGLLSHSEDEDDREDWQTAQQAQPPSTEKLISASWRPAPVGVVHHPQQHVYHGGSVSPPSSGANVYASWGEAAHIGPTSHSSIPGSFRSAGRAPRPSWSDVRPLE